MNKSTLKIFNKLAVVILCILGLVELALAIWTVLENRYKALAYNLADVGYIDLWILRYLSLCLFASSIITLVMCLIIIWGLCSAHVFLFIASTMILFIVIGELTVSILTFTNKYETRLTLNEQLPKLVITYRQGTDERANRALDILQSTFRCCGSDGRLSFQNNVPLSCNMYSVGCLTRTMHFLDAYMDALAYILLFFSIIKLFVILYFYSFLCVYQRYRQKSFKSNHHLVKDSSIWRHSSSFDSSSTENLPKKFLMSNHNENDNEYIEKRRVLFNEYESSLPNKQPQMTTTIISPSSLLNNNSLTTCYEQQGLRKLSSISEKTEKTETDDSDPDLVRLKHYIPKRKAIITAVNQKQYPSVLPKKLPIIKSRRKIVRDYENENDSGVEHSSSEKSFDDHNTEKQYSDSSTTIYTNSKRKQAKNKSSSSLSFSNLFVTSVSKLPTTEEQFLDDEVKKPLTTSSSSLTDPFLFNDTKMPKPILKKTTSHSLQTNDQNRTPPSYRDQKKISSIINLKGYPLLHNTPKIIPRSSLKQSKQEESLV